MENFNKLILTAILTGITVTSGIAMQYPENIEQNSPTRSGVGMHPPAIKKPKLDIDAAAAEPAGTEISDINSIDHFGNTALHNAVLRNDVEFLQNILYNRIDVNVNAVNRFKQTPLHIATEKCHVDFLQILLTMPGININAVDMFTFTALHLAAEHGNANCLRALLRMPCINLNALNEFGRTALYFAQLNKHEDCVRILLGHGGQLVILPFQTRHIIK